MRQIAFLTIIGAVTLISCKKKETQPEPTAPQPTSPTPLTIEQTYDLLEAGTWLADSVEFYQNNTITQTAYLVKDYTFTTVGGTIKQLKWENSPATFSYILSDPTTITIQGSTGGMFSGTNTGIITTLSNNRLILKCPDNSTEGTYRYFHR